MNQVHVGKTKESLDCVDPSLSIADVTRNFVKFTMDEAPEQVNVAEVGYSVGYLD